MANISSPLKDKLEQDPNAKVSVIVRVQGESAARVPQVKTLGLNVKHVYTLISGFALEGPGSSVLALANEPWVVSIEEDKPVHTM